MIDCTTQAQSGDDDMGGDNVAVSMEESKMDDFFQEVVMMVMVMVVMVMMMMSMRMVMTMMMVLMMDTVHGGEQDGRLLPRGDDGDDDYVDEDGDKEDSDGDDDDVLKKSDNVKTLIL